MLESEKRFVASVKRLWALSVAVLVRFVASSAKLLACAVTAPLADDARAETF